MSNVPQTLPKLNKISWISKQFQVHLKKKKKNTHVNSDRISKSVVIVRSLHIDHKSLLKGISVEVMLNKIHNPLLKEQPSLNPWGIK